MAAGAACLAVAVIAMLAGKRPAQVYPVNLASGHANAVKSGVRDTLFGITAFPYDTTPEAVDRTRSIVAANGTLWAIHLDNGIPWRALLDGAPLPHSLQADWDGQTRAIPRGRPVYVGIAPLDTDRKSLAPAVGPTGRTAMPPELRDAAFDDLIVERAYLDYARLVVKQFHPRFLNIGIEAGELMSRDMTRWPAFRRLYGYVYDNLKREHPSLQIGISFGLGELRSEVEAVAARPLIAKSDYVGLSFYPYASQFDEKFGAPPYGGATPWREPLAWVRAYTDKPLAICETGYSSKGVAIPRYGLNMPGSTQQQAAYVRDLFATARGDRYAFAVWFLAVDYDRLYAKMPPGSDAMKLWLNIGLFDGDLRPKPAWAEWRAGIAAARKQGG